MGLHDNSGSDQEDPAAVEATDRSIEILQSLKDDGPATLTEIATRLEYSKSTVHRHLATLERNGYIAEGEDGYQIGLLYLDFGIHARDRNRLYQTAKALLAHLGQDRIDEPLGSISVAGPANRMKDDYLETELPELLLGVANEIEVNLTYQ